MPKHQYSSFFQGLSSFLGIVSVPLTFICPPAGILAGVASGASLTFKGYLNDNGKDVGFGIIQICLSAIPGIAALQAGSRAASASAIAAGNSFEWITIGNNVHGIVTSSGKFAFGASNISKAMKIADTSYRAAQLAESSFNTAKIISGISNSIGVGVNSGRLIKDTLFDNNNEKYVSLGVSEENSYAFSELWRGDKFLFQKICLDRNLSPQQRSALIDLFC